MCLTPNQLDLLRFAGTWGVAPADEPTTADLRLLARAGLVVEDEGGRFVQTDAGRRYELAENAPPRSS